MQTPYPFDTLDGRRSVPSSLLSEPGPDHPTLMRMLHSAVRVPDHGKLVPFRFLRISGKARSELGDFLARRTRERDPSTTDTAIEKDRQRFQYAPVIVAVIARTQCNSKIPEQEQLLTAGCVCFALLQAAQAHGFGAQWLTAWMAYDLEVAAHLGLAQNERIVGFIHIGTARAQVPERERPDPQLLLQDWGSEHV